jgi:hypothetical protein
MFGTRVCWGWFASKAPVLHAGLLGPCICTNCTVHALNIHQPLTPPALQIVDGKTKAAADAEETFKSEVAKLQAKYEELSSAKDAAIEESGKDMRVMRQVITSAEAEDSTGSSTKDEL